MGKHFVDIFRRNGHVRPAIGEDAVLAVRLDLDNGVALWNLRALQIAQINAAACKQVC